MNIPYCVFPCSINFRYLQCLPGFKDFPFLSLVIHNSYDCSLQYENDSTSVFTWKFAEFVFAT